MQITSVEFIFIFLPVFIGIYRLLPASRRNGVLLCGSLVFYWLASGGDWVAFGVLAGVCLVTWGLGQLLHEYRKGWLLGLTLMLTLGSLVFLKCWEHGRLLTPGMSFFTLQAAAYLIDVYRDRIWPSSLIRYSAGITAFPKLLSGPLVEPRELQRQVWSRASLKTDFGEGVQELILGLSMKVLLADRLGTLWSQAAVIGYDGLSVGLAWMSLAAYAGQLYFDFFGYSLMAIGLGKMLGFRFPENFRDPYASHSVSEFYRRWHITLGAWFREYVYFPLGGSRVGKCRTVFNLAVVWLLTGLWHGGGWNYLLWAGWLWLFITLERLIYGKWLQKSKVICHVYTVAVILLSWAPFAIGDLGQLGVFVGRLFGVGGIGMDPMDIISTGQEYFGLLAAALVLATPLPRKLWDRWRNGPVMDILLFILFWVAVYFVVTAAQDPFLYYRF